MSLDGLAAHVTPEAVLALLIGRAPEILDDDHRGQFEDAVRGATAEVVPLIGSDPGDGPKRDLAVRCIAYGAAAELEAALFPEQQSPGDSGRAFWLSKRYNELRAQLEKLPNDDPPEAGSTPPLGPTGSFPPPQRYPDPASGCW